MMRFTFLLLTLIWLSCSNTNNNNQAQSTEKYIAFNGVEWVEPDFVLVEKAPDNNSEKANLLAVLAFYGVPTKYEEGKIWIREQQLSDLNFLWNLTLKAQDSTWYKKHLLPKKNMFQE